MLTGRVERVRLDSAVVTVGGIGLHVLAAPNTLAGLTAGEEATLATSLVVREDSLTLYGFADEDARDVFEKLQTVSGVGPRLALAMLAVHSPDGLRAAVADEDITALTKVPGVGKKGAGRLVLELGGKLGAAPGAGAGAPGPAETPASGAEDQVIEALVGLGWNRKQATDGTRAVLAVTGTDKPVADLLREVLREMGRRS
nr:Holliday junction branch migration protein RuvA [Spelaeicoccus albus]